MALHIFIDVCIDFIYIILIVNRIEIVSLYKCKSIYSVKSMSFINNFVFVSWVDQNDLQVQDV